MWLLRLRYSCMAKEALTKSFKSYIAQKIQFVNVSQTNNFNTNQNVLITFKGRVCNWLLLRNQCVVCCINVNLPPPPPSLQARKCLCKFRNLYVPIEGDTLWVSSYTSPLQIHTLWKADSGIPHTPTIKESEGGRDT